MTYITHEIAGLTLGLGYMLYTKNIDYIPLTILIVSSLLPDLDEPNSKSGRKVSNISYLIKKIFGHRGITHSLVFILVLAGFIYGIILYYSLPFNYLIYFILGYISHIFSDLLTKSGVPLFYPYKKNISVPIITTNNFSEKIFRSLISLVFVYQTYLLFLYQIELLDSIIRR
ncbi:MAG: metal-dependent hydrolase [Candidatus Woesearchaeota archaeon]